MKTPKQTTRRTVAVQVTYFEHEIAKIDAVRGGISRTTFVRAKSLEAADSKAKTEA